MVGIDDQRGEGGRKVGLEVAARLLLLRRRQLDPAAQRDAVLGQPGNDVPAVAVGLPADLPEEGVAGAAASRRAPPRYALTEHGHALHEELVEVGGEDREELHPFEQGGALVAGLAREPAR